MAWQRLAQPVTVNTAICRPYWNEIIAAANERNAETLKAAALPDLTGQVLRVSHLTAIRSRIEALVPYFADPDTGFRWTKTTCLQAAIGKANWTTSALSHKKAIRAPHLTDLKNVLDKLTHVLVGTDAAFTPTGDMISVSVRRASFGDAWSDAKTAYSAAGYSYPAGNGVCGLYSTAWWSAPIPLQPTESLEHVRLTAARIVVPSFGLSVVSSKLAFKLIGDFRDDATFNAYTQAGFAGAACPFTVPSGAVAGGGVAVGIPTVTSGTTMFASVRTDVDHLSTAVLDAYRPDDPVSPNTNAMERALQLHRSGGDLYGGLLVQLAFQYQS